MVVNRPGTVTALGWGPAAAQRPFTSIAKPSCHHEAPLSLQCRRSAKLLKWQLCSLLLNCNWHYLARPPSHAIENDM